MIARRSFKVGQALKPIQRFYTVGRENRMDWNHSNLPEDQSGFDQKLKDAALNDKAPGPAYTINEKGMSYKEKQDAQTGAKVFQEGSKLNRNKTQQQSGSNSSDTSQEFKGKFDNIIKEAP